MREVTVSIVMPAYNCANYIGQAIQSVLVQSVPLELIIVEDCSSDGTKEVINSFLSDGRIIYIENKQNKGVSTSRNIGISRARGKYIAFLDADDYWVPDKLERQLQQMEELGAVLSSTGRELMDEKSNLTGKIIGIPEVIRYKDLLKGNVLNTSGVMLLADVAREFPMQQDHLHEDYIMWLSILRKYHVAYGINEPLLKYRVMRETKSGNKLKSAQMTFGVYRYMGLNIVQCCYYFCNYAVRGFLKYW